MSDHRSDETLMRGYRDGALAAFAELYRRHSQGLYRLLAWRSSRRAWGIMQDSWGNLYQARERYQPGRYRSSSFPRKRESMRHVQGKLSMGSRFRGNDPTCISADDSKVAVWVVHANEELMIARQTLLEHP